MMKGLTLRSRDWTRLPSDFDWVECEPAVQRQRALAALEPRDLSFFASFFGPLFPEVLPRTWLIRGLPDLAYPFAWYDDFDRQLDAVDEIEGLAIAGRPGYGWVLVPGEYLVRTANHLCEAEHELYGFCRGSCSTSWLACQLPADDRTSVSAQVSALADLQFRCYERIWAVFARSEKLLERVRRHVGPIAHVKEIPEEVGPDGNWLG
jgi:hypothetical protein